jgi:hypothetical protein
MRLKLMAAIGLTALCLHVPVGADETNKLTYLTFNKATQLPGVMLPAGRYRFELADTVESRRVIKVASEDGKRQLGLMLSIPNQLQEPAKDPVVLFAETPQGQPDAIKAWVYPGESIGYEFIYPHDEALAIAKRSHTSVLSKSGETIERINERGEKAPGTSK